MTSRQWKWQQKKQKAGLCMKCGKPRNLSMVHCDEHLEYDRNLRRKKTGVKNPHGSYLQKRANRDKEE